MYTCICIYIYISIWQYILIIGHSFYITCVASPFAAACCQLAAPDWYLGRWLGDSQLISTSPKPWNLGWTLSLRQWHQGQPQFSLIDQQNPSCQQQLDGFLENGSLTRNSAHLATFVWSLPHLHATSFSIFGLFHMVSSQQNSLKTIDRKLQPCNSSQLKSGKCVGIPDPKNGSCHPGGDDWILDRG